ncbi:hypothetical protein DSO57_1030180 [Entomophthora muscae]|uniref:Uncharacterized protein n=1 Tax=Entomophthora muscae TaxID=34485 RepID=A0ACC2SQ15_9FUNG|nr:hypothetical protein DSO57_1030180 [Entomophthora muscae]
MASTCTYSSITVPTQLAPLRKERTIRPQHRRTQSRDANSATKSVKRMHNLRFLPSLETIAE